jgi:drug/metabolite transporter (DMT)-like permease
VLGKRRHPVAVWLGLPLITLGVYSAVWVYKTNQELARYDRRIVVNPVLSVLACTLGGVLLVPPFVAAWRLGARTAQAQRAAGVPELNAGLAFLLFFVGAGPLYLQANINKIWARYPVAVEGQQVPLAG